MRRFIKKLSLSILLLATVVSILVSLSSCAFLLPKVSDKLPDEEIIKVEKVTEITYDNIVYQELPEEKMVQFEEYLGKLRYMKRYNIFGYKYSITDSEEIRITYESYTVELGEHNMTVRSDNRTDWLQLDGIYPEDTFAEMFELFED